MDIKAWDVEFVKVDQSTLFELILAANYMNIKSLLDLACLSVANMIKGKSPDEIRKARAGRLSAGARTLCMGLRRRAGSASRSRIVRALCQS